MTVRLWIPLECVSGCVIQEFFGKMLSVSTPTLALRRFLGARRSRNPRSMGGALAGGALAVEFALLLFSAITLFAFVGEFLRLSLIDQQLSRTTHRAARAVAGLRTGTGCEAEVRRVFGLDDRAAWLMDANNDGVLEVQVATANGWPDQTLGGDVRVNISWDEDPADGVTWNDAVSGGCGRTGTWLRLRAHTVVRPWYGPFRPLAPNGLHLQHESWGHNNRI